MATEPEVTDDPATWPDWLRAQRDQAREAAAEARRKAKARREAEHTEENDPCLSG